MKVPKKRLRLLISRLVVPMSRLEVKRAKTIVQRRSKQVVKVVRKTKQKVSMSRLDVPMTKAK